MPDKRNYYNIITDTWKLLKEHLDGADFDRIRTQVSELDARYKGSEEYDFAKLMVVAVMTELNRLYGGGE